VKVIYRHRVHSDLDAIFRYIARDNPLAAKKVISRITLSVSRLNRFPFLGRHGLKPGTRELSVPGVPYVIIYRVVEDVDEDFVEIVAIYHTARNRPRR
jgi:toxin ParE1/3/4